jgi:hypothetical protein
MVKYENGKIYKIVCNKTGLLYVGSTTLQLCKRMAIHKKAFVQYSRTNKGYMTVFDIIKNGDYNIILLEDCPSENRENLLKKEREYFDKLECVNKERPHITDEEKIEMDKFCKRNYRENNKEAINLKHKEYNEINRDKRHEYTLKNRDKKAEYDTIRRESFKTTCQCGSVYFKRGIACEDRHLHTKKHIDFIQSEENKDNNKDD